MINTVQNGKGSFKAFLWFSLSFRIEFTVLKAINNNNVYFSLKYKLLLMRKIGMNWGTHYPYRSYQGSMNELSITVPNDKGHFSISAGVCSNLNIGRFKLRTLFKCVRVEVGFKQVLYLGIFI